VLLDIDAEPRAEPASEKPDFCVIPNPVRLKGEAV
jgi:hypothetical protein